jgi:hypothetical protein
MNGSRRGAFGATPLSIFRVACANGYQTDGGGALFCFVQSELELHASKPSHWLKNPFVAFISAQRKYMLRAGMD